MAKKKAAPKRPTSMANRDQMGPPMAMPNMPPKGMKGKMPKKMGKKGC